MWPPAERGTRVAPTSDSHIDGPHRASQGRLSPRGDLETVAMSPAGEVA